MGITKATGAGRGKQTARAASGETVMRQRWSMGDGQVDWDYVHQSNFESAAFWDINWIGKARNLLGAAKTSSTPRSFWSGRATVLMRRMRPFR